MALTNVLTNNPVNFTIENSKNARYLCDIVNVYNNDSDIPLQKYVFLIKNVRVVNIQKKLMTISLTLNNPQNKKIYDFIDTLERSIGAKINNKECKSNISINTSIVNICLYFKSYVVYDENNIDQPQYTLKTNSLVSIIIKLSQVSCENNTYIPIWKLLQVKLHSNPEKKCMFDIQSAKTVSTLDHCNVRDAKVTSSEKLGKCDSPNDKQKQISQSFVPSVGDIMSIKNQLRKVKVDAISVVKCVDPTDIPVIVNSVSRVSSPNCDLKRKNTDPPKNKSHSKNKKHKPRTNNVPK